MEQLASRLAAPKTESQNHNITKSQNHEITVETVKNALPESVRGLVEIQLKHTDKEAWIEVVKYAYLSDENWRLINEALNRLGGKWTPQGKESHWRIPVKKTEP